MTDSSLAPKPRRSRLQFSLRLLLLAFTAFAIGFPIWYRWPFEETEHQYLRGDKTKPPDATITKTWRRTWGGGKVQHGRAVMDYGRPPRKTIEHFSNGQRHGSFENYFYGKLSRTGQYVHGQREGTWVGYDHYGDQKYTAHWHQDRLDGFYEDSGNQRFNFSMGRLTDFNGKPVQNRLLEQLALGSIDDPRIAAELGALMPVGMVFVETPLQDAIGFLQDQHNIPIVLDARRVKDVDLPLTVQMEGIDLCSALTLLAAPRDLGFDYRYGVLFLTTAENLKEWRDPTGASDIRPPAGSALARVWNEPSIMEFVETPLKEAAQYLADAMAIGFDISALPENRQSMPVTKSAKGTKGIPWRHALGLMLDDLNLRCEARGGDTLVILPPEAP